MTAAAAPTITRRRRTGRQFVAGGIGAVLAIAGLVAATRHDGYPQRDVRVFAGTRWLVDRDEGAVVLADAASGRATARIVVPLRAGNILDAVQSDHGAFLIDRTTGEVVAIDQKGVKLADTRRVQELDDTKTWILGAGDPGAVAAAGDGTTVTVPESGEPTMRELSGASLARIISVDGAIWTHGLGRQIERTTAEGTRQIRAGVGEGSLLGSVGSSAALLDRDDHTLEWLLERQVVQLPLTLELADAVIQSPGASAPCIWIGAADQLACVAHGEVTTQHQLASFSFRSSDRLLSAAGVVAVVRQDGSVVRIDPTSGVVTPITGLDWDEEVHATTASDEVVIWVDDPDGATALAITARSTRIIFKRADGTAEFDAEGVPTMASLGGAPALETAEAPGAVDAPTGRPRAPDDDGVDDPPIALNDHTSVRRGNTITVTVTANDYDPDGGPVALVDVGSPAHGSARQLNASSAVYTPDSGSFLEDAFEYTIVDSTGNSATATVTIDVRPPGAPNGAPIAGDDTASTSPGRAITVDVLGNDTDPDGDPLVIGSPTIDDADGRVEVVAAGGGRPQLRVSPADGLAGRSIRLTYRAVDTLGAKSSPASVEVQVASGNEANRAPVALPDSAQVIAGETVVIPVLANDIDDDNDILAIDDVSIDGRDGSATVRGDTIVYRAPSNFDRRVVFSYVVSDPAGETARGTVLVNVVPAGGENQAPVAVPDVKTAAPGTNRFDVLENDIDPDGDPLVITEVTRRTGRTGRVWTDGRLVFYEPNPSGSESAEIAYTISDGSRTSSSTVTVTVRSDRDPQGPVAEHDRVNVEPGVNELINVLANDTDPNGDPLTVEVIDGCRGATCDVTSNQRISFTAPVDSDVTQYQVTYRVTNSVGQSDEAVLRITVMVRASGSAPPVAVNDSDTIVSGTPKSIDVLGNDFDPDGLDVPLTLDRVNGSVGVFTAEVVGNEVFVSAPAGTRDSASFDYVVSDPEGNTDTGTLVVRADPPSNRPPIVPTRSITLDAEESSEEDFLEGVTDDGPESELRLTGRPVVADPALLSITPGGSPSSFVLTARPGAQADTSVDFEVIDVEGSRQQGKLVVRFSPLLNRAPTARNDEASALSGQTIRHDVIENDNDLDGDELTARIVSGPDTTQGTAIAEGRFIRFTPRPGFEGTSTLTYEAVDTTGKISNVARFSVRVAACTVAAPTVIDRPDEFTRFDTPLPIDVGLAAGSTLRIDDVTGGETTPPVGGRFVFTPDPGNNSSGTIRYTVANPCGQTGSALITIDVNRSPRLEPLTLTALIGEAIEVPVVRFASDDEALTISDASSTGGAVTVVDGGRALRFVPTGPPGERVTIAVTVADPGGLRASGTISVDVLAVDNAIPVAADDSIDLSPGVTTALDLLRNDSDADHPTSSLTVRLGTLTVPLDRGGTVSLSLAPDQRTVMASASGDAHGRATFNYTAVDPAGGVSTPATVIVEVNRLPLSVTAERTITAGSTDTFTPYEPGVPPDIDGDAIVNDVLSRTDARVGVQFLEGLLIQLTVPADVPTGDVVVVYSITDDYGAQSTGRITIRVIGGPTPTIAPSDPVAADPGEPVPFGPEPLDTIAPPVEG